MLSELGEMRYDSVLRNTRVKPKGVKRVLILERNHTQLLKFFQIHILTPINASTFGIKRDTVWSSAIKHVIYHLRTKTFDSVNQTWIWLCFRTTKRKIMMRIGHKTT